VNIRFLNITNVYLHEYLTESTSKKTSTNFGEKIYILNLTYIFHI